MSECTKKRSVEPIKPQIILHLNMDNFYASMEMQVNPELRNKPVVIGTDPKRGRGRGVFSTYSSEARAFGLYPYAIYPPPDFALYLKVSAEVTTFLRSCGFHFQQVSIDSLQNRSKQLSKKTGPDLFDQDCTEQAGCQDRV
jgi:hypothetical protein